MRRGNPHQQLRAPVLVPSTGFPGGSSLRQPHNYDYTALLDELRPSNVNAFADQLPTISRKRRHAGSSPERMSNADSSHSANAAGRRPPGFNDGSQRGVGRGSAGHHSPPLGHHLTQPGHRPAMPQSASGSNENIRAGIGGVPTIRRNESDITPPHWQPDTEVDQCPVCRREFSFWYRKHHCRKCGRVVCAACSPHRITIPRQYIVHPPNTLEAGHGMPTVAPLSPSSYNPALGGGEVVRVCNPCVPDPWTPGAPSDDGPASTPSQNSWRTEGANEGSRPQRYRHGRPPTPPHLVPIRVGTRAQPHQQASTLSHSRPRLRSQDFVAPPYPASHEPYPQVRLLVQPSVQPPIRPSIRPPVQPPAQPIPPNFGPTDQTRALGASFGSRVNPEERNIPISRPRNTRPTTPSQQQPRRQIREEDECPVCGTELPQGDTIREAHIQECIATRFSSTPSQAAHVPPHTSSADNVHTASQAYPIRSPQHAARPNSAAGNTTLSSSAAAAAVTVPTRPRATSFRPRGMALYHATEKDCTSADGEPRECVICFEEFQPGDEMGRMECLCIFHRTCIRRWWDTKGTGSCPTHQLQE